MQVSNREYKTDRYHKSSIYGVNDLLYRLAQIATAYLGFAHSRTISPLHRIT